MPRPLSTACAAFTLFAVREEDSERITGYAVLHPETSEVVAHTSFPNGYCHMPILLMEEDAQRLAAALTRRTGSVWVAEGAPNPCSHCGTAIWADDRDFCYPSNRERTHWTASCHEHNFGCGHSVEASSYEEVMALWNRRKTPRDLAIRRD